MSEPATPQAAAEAADPGASERVAALRADLLAWYEACGRDLPWRRTRDPYAILVSELMLQQTQVERVARAWPAFLAAFPSVEALAAAPVGAVVTAWRGLGYNRRAVRLSEAARRLVDDHGGQVPADVEALERLPGVGAYTARAVAAFAFERPAAPVDTNVARVLARAVAGAPLSARRGQQLADALVPADRAAAWSHALMDLGSGHCTARSPRCPSCPLAARCVWYATGGQDPAVAGARRPRPQGRFEGSDRWYRGRLVDALRAGAMPWTAVEATLDGLDEDGRRRIVDGLAADGLVERGDWGLALAGGHDTEGGRDG